MTGLYLRRGVSTFLAIGLLTVLQLVLIGSAPVPTGKSHFELRSAGVVKLNDLSVEDAAVIDEATVVVVGTKSNKDGDEDPDRLDPNGAIVGFAEKVVRPFTNGHTARICRVSVSRGRIATTSTGRDPVLRVWDLKAGKTVATVEIDRPGGVSTHYGVAWFHKSDRVAVAAGKRVIVLDPGKPGEREELAIPAGSSRWVEKPTVSPDDSLLACTADRADVVVWEMATRKGIVFSLVPDKVDDPKQWLSGGVEFGPKGMLIAWRHGSDSEVPERQTEAETPAERRGVVSIDRHSGRVTPLGLGTSVYTLSCATDPTAKWLATAGSARPDEPRSAGNTTLGELRVYNLVTKELAFREQVAGHPLCWVAFTPSGKRIVSASYDGVVRWWDVRGE